MKLILLQLTIITFCYPAFGNEVIPLKSILGELPLRNQVEKKYPKHKIKYSHNDSTQLFSVYANSTLNKDNVVIIISPNYIITKYRIHRNKIQVEEKPKLLQFTVNNQNKKTHEKKNIGLYTVGCIFDLKKNENFAFYIELERNGEIWILETSRTSMKWSSRVRKKQTN